MGWAIRYYPWRLFNCKISGDGEMMLFTLTIGYLRETVLFQL